MLHWLKLSQCLYVLHKQSNIQSKLGKGNYGLALADHSRNHSIIQDISIRRSSSVAQKQIILVVLFLL